MANLGVPGMAIIFRIGWEVRNIHTIFDYIQNSIEMGMEAARQLSGWGPSRGPGFHEGGHSPNKWRDAIDEQRCTDLQWMEYTT